MFAITSVSLGRKLRDKVRIEIEENVVVSLAKLKSLQIYLHNHFFQAEKRTLPVVNWLEHALHAYFTARTKCEHILIPVRTNASDLIADALNSAGETRAEKCVFCPQAKQTLVGGKDCVMSQKNVCQGGWRLVKFLLSVRAQSCLLLMEEVT